MVYHSVVTQRSTPICGKEHCVTAQKTAVLQTIRGHKIAEVVESVVDSPSSCYYIMTCNE